MRPSNPDVAAFHEGFSDLIALLMRFRYKDVVRRGLEESKDETPQRWLRRNLSSSVTPIFRWKSGETVRLSLCQ